MYIEFKNQKTDNILYKIEYQMYSTGAIGGPGLSYCKNVFKNNPDYKFSAGGFVTGDFIKFKEN